MRLRHIRGAEETIATSPYVIQEPELHKGSWNQVFGNDNPIQIEVGMGKGRFIMELAQQNPDINYIGIERYSSVLLRGLQKRAQLELNNIYFMCIDAKNMADYFAPGEVDKRRRPRAFQCAAGHAGACAGQRNPSVRSIGCLHAGAGPCNPGPNGIGSRRVPACSTGQRT